MAILLSGRANEIEQRIFILADDWDPSPFRFFAKKYESARGWEIIKMRCGHSVTVDKPSELAAVSSVRALARRSHLDHDLRNFVAVEWNEDSEGVRLEPTGRGSGRLFSAVIAGPGERMLAIEEVSMHKIEISP